MSLPWMKFDPAAWMVDTRVLSPTARGVWIDLICMMWQQSDSGGPLTKKVSALARMISLPEQEFREILEEFEQFDICFIKWSSNGLVTELVTGSVTGVVTDHVTGVVTELVTGGKDQYVTIACRRMLREAKEREGNRERQSKKRASTENVTGGVTVQEEKRIEEKREEEIREDQESALRLDCPSETQKPKRRKSWTRDQLRAEGYEAYPNFMVWWKAYPNSKAKRGAFEVWVRDGLEFEDQEMMLRVLRAHCRSPEWVKDSGQYVPHAATYLNSRRFEDEPEELEREQGKPVTDAAEEPIRRFRHG
jgi:hypothetical protein